MTGRRVAMLVVLVAVIAYHSIARSGDGATSESAPSPAPKLIHRDTRDARLGEATPRGHVFRDVPAGKYMAQLEGIFVVPSDLASHRADQFPPGFSVAGADGTDAAADAHVAREGWLALKLPPPGPHTVRAGHLVRSGAVRIHLPAGEYAFPPATVRKDDSGTIATFSTGTMFDLLVPRRATYHVSIEIGESREAAPRYQGPFQVLTALNTRYLVRAPRKGAPGVSFAFFEKGYQGCVIDDEGCHKQWPKRGPGTVAIRFPQDVVLRTEPSDDRGSAAFVVTSRSDFTLTLPQGTLGYLNP